MAHFAELDEQNKVIRVIVVNNAEIMNGNIESEQKGIDFCKSLFGEQTKWVQTSYNGAFRGKFAAIGDLYDGNIFISEAQQIQFVPTQEITKEQLLAQLQTLQAQIQALE